MGQLKKVNVWYSVQGGGDGNAHPFYFLTKEEAQHDQDTMDEGWSAPCYGLVETFVGSNVHRNAMNNRANNAAELD